VTRLDPERPTRVAVVGAGVWGEQHARVFAAHPDAELVAIGGRTPERTEARARAYGVPGYVDLEAMLERERPDLVTVCLPNEGHFEPTLALLRTGVALLVEKPLVFELDEADALLAEAERDGTFFAINFNHRFAVPIQRAAEAVHGGRLGAPVFATWRFGGEPGTSGHPHANLIETQCHGFDALELLCGPIDAVSSEMTDLTGRGFSTMALALHFANGAVGSLVGTYDSSYAYPATHLLELNGTDGRLLVEDTVRRLTVSRAGSETREVWEAGYFNDRDREFHRTFDRHADALLAALRAGDEPPVHARAGRRALELAHAAIRSFEDGRRVAVTPA
jgi:myo-inositol 2-dehydrogenase/D-chiro-inositol 1-dehydrogenase